MAADVRALAIIERTMNAREPQEASSLQNHAGMPLGYALRFQ
jgi:hypothetical protein